MNFTKKPEIIYSIYLIFLKIGMAIFLIYVIRQIILILFLLIHLKRKRIEIDEPEDHSLREEQGRLETNYLHYTTVDHLFNFEKIDKKRRKIKKHLISKSNNNVKKATEKTEKIRRAKKGRKNDKPIPISISGFDYSSDFSNEYEFQRSLIDEFSIQSTPVNKSSLLALSLDSVRSNELEQINEQKIQKTYSISKISN